MSQPKQIDQWSPLACFPHWDGGQRERMGTKRSKEYTAYSNLRKTVFHWSQINFQYFFLEDKTGGIHSALFYFCSFLIETTSLYLPEYLLASMFYVIYGLFILWYLWAPCHAAQHLFPYSSSFSCKNHPGLSLYTVCCVWQPSCHTPVLFEHKCCFLVIWKDVWRGAQLPLLSSDW